MLIGLTYDLRSDYLAEGWDEIDVAEFDRDDTIEAIELALRTAGHEVDRIGHARRLMSRLLRGDRWDLVFNFAESQGGFGRESLVPALLEAHGIPYTFSDPLACAVTLHKATAKRVLRDAGIATPDFLLIETHEDIRRCTLNLPLFAKPVAEGSSKGVDARARIRTREELASVCASLLERFQQPVLVEEYLPGREVTVGLIGTGEAARVVGVLEVELLSHAEQEIYTYANKEECETRVRYTLIDDAFAGRCAAAALATWRVLGCRDGGRVDLRADARGAPSVIEVNPLPGLHPEHSDLPIMWSQAGRPFEELIRQIVDSAALRVNQSPRTTPSGAERQPCTS